ncbi:MAG: lipoyl(octanoyl) transferase LipB [Bacteroidetes bacterium SB0662_bin_6]|nr:lipoyl(octanoyl) transferase LipB [Bacteroidetes bacterium SB0668_bin_1]MYE04426.1 lipoyl(octanoyl) transferase LipB [Bacteroidetes bacterium SB0662_bin_6]
MSTSRSVMVCDIGQMDYRPAWALQQRIQHRLITAKRRTPPEALPHVFLFVEHPPVYTIGKSGNRRNLLVSEELLRRRGAEFVEIDRGGDITYHGPGQIVGYPILDLDRFVADIHKYLRLIEQTIIDTCASYGVQGGRIAGRTGVWIDADATAGPGNEIARKICAMGIRCSRWVTMHGFALNVSTDLNWFSHIVPCGISDGNVTSLEKETEHALDPKNVKEKIVHHFANLFEAQVRQFSGIVANEFLADFLEE